MRRKPVKFYAKTTCKDDDKIQERVRTRIIFEVMKIRVLYARLAPIFIVLCKTYQPFDQRTRYQLVKWSKLANLGFKWARLCFRSDEAAVLTSFKYSRTYCGKVVILVTSGVKLCRRLQAKQPRTLLGRRCSIMGSNPDIWVEIA